MANTVHLIASAAPLLSGNLNDCTSPDDSSCHGGIAAAAAFIRAYSQGDPVLLMPFLDRRSPFVQMSPLGWSVNRLVHRYLVGAKAFLSAPSILLQNKADSEVTQRDISDLQSREMPLLLSNVNVPLENTWNAYVYPIHMDPETRLATMSIINSNGPFVTTSQIDTVLGGLDYLARLNEEAGCIEDDATASLFQTYIDATSQLMADRPRPPIKVDAEEEETICWIPVIIYADVRTNLEKFLMGVLTHENPPAFILDVEQNIPPFDIPRQIGPSQTWFLSLGLHGTRYQHNVITLSKDRKRIIKVDLIHHDLDLDIPSAPSNVRDELYNVTIETLAELAKEARVNDPVVASSQAMPIQRLGNYRRCSGGPCESATLYLDALRWWTGASIAFGNSGGFRGEGWPAGPIRISNLWDLLPFPNNLCTGLMSGVSIFNAFNYSVGMATFEGHNTETGGLLLQVSGMRITYNTQMTGSRLIAIDIWDEEKQNYLPIERLKLYTFATDSYMCTGHRNFRDFFTSRLVFPGEQAGQLDTSIIVQEVTSQYLMTFDSTYQPTKEDRMVNDTDATTFLDLVQTELSCTDDEFWNREQYTCVACPRRTSGVIFLKDSLEFESEVGVVSSTIQTKNISFANTLSHNVTVVARSLPPWFQIVESSRPISDRSTDNIVFEELDAGAQVALEVAVDFSELEPGTATGSAIFGLMNDNEFPGCTRPDAKFDLNVRVKQPEDLNQLGNVRVFGWVASLVVIATSLILTAWVVSNRKTRIVRTLQPVFLVSISMGVLIMGSALIPLGFDDEIVSAEGSSMACMAFPWLLSMGFTIAMSALFSKIWRINKLFHNTQLRRITVKEKDVIVPFAVLFCVNFLALMVWTLVDPLRWARKEVAGQNNQSYGVCRASDGAVSTAMISVVGVVNISAFVVACYQAFRARWVSDEFSESKSLGVALFSWVQLLLIGVPVLFLIDDDNPSARYFITAGLTFAVCMSMLLLIYVPILIQQRKAEKRLVDETRVQKDQGLQQSDHSSVSGEDFVRRSSSRSSPGVSSTFNPSNWRFSLTNMGKPRISGLDFDLKTYGNVLMKTMPSVEEDSSKDLTPINSEAFRSNPEVFQSEPVDLPTMSDVTKSTDTATEDDFIQLVAI